jgi:DNA-binding SARP family transcriptional activator
LLGSPEVRLDGKLVTGFHSSKAQALLYYLAVTARSHTRLSLAGLLWGDLSDTQARLSLTQGLSNLHQLGGDYVLIERQSAAFNQEQLYWLDVASTKNGA